MLLAFYNHKVEYKRLLSLLDIGPIGAPRRNIMHATRLGIDMLYREATMPILLDYLQSGVPVIAFVDTGELPYWTSTTNHAVVVIGVQGGMLFINDPAFEDSPQRVSVGDFELAWLNADYMCAVSH